MNGNQVIGHTRLIVSTIGILSAGALALGAWLIFKGYQTGELLIQTGGSGVTGLLGFLGGKATQMKTEVIAAPEVVGAMKPEEKT